jgi:uncharacterized protein (TIGR01777 family)
MNILITGGSGLLGQRLTQQLQAAGHEVVWLGRSGRGNKVKTAVWNPAKGIIDQDAVNAADAIIHLAGANVAAEKWTARYKRVIIDSREQSGQLLVSAIKKRSRPLAVFISASATGWYGLITDDRLHKEDEPAANDFFGETCKRWEAATQELDTITRRVVFRIGVVISKDGGAFPKLAAPVRVGIGSALGSGEQWIPWIHIDDVVGMMKLALDNEQLRGIYNAAAPNQITQHDFTVAAAQQYSRPLWLPKVPAFVLKMMLGEMSGIVLEGCRVDIHRIRNVGYRYKYETIQQAIAAEAASE